MAHTATHIETTTPSFAPISRVFSALFNALVRAAENNPKMRQITALAALSDEELAAKGLTRDGIARHVMRTSYWV